MSPMPEPGDRHPGFVSEPMRCWALVYDGTMQADPCIERPSWTGRWFSTSGTAGGECGIAPTTWTG